MCRIIQACKLSEHSTSECQLPMQLHFKKCVCQNKRGCTPLNFPIQCMLICWLGSPRSLLPDLYCLHEGCAWGKPAVHMLWVIQFIFLLVEKAGAAPDVTLRFTACKKVRVQVRELPWLWNPWGGSHKVQNMSNQWPHKMNLSPTKISRWGGVMGGSCWGEYFNINVQNWTKRN